MRQLYKTVLPVCINPVGTWLAYTGKYKRHKHQVMPETADPREKGSLIHRTQTPLRWRGRAAGKNNLRILTERLQLGDWFLVYQLGRNMEPMVYGEFLKEFAGELENSLATLERKPMLS
ncbi:Innexin inx2 [Armadillidium nasatum]|uniref:Innexin inx2 n=1 Tax=Armadillidium nasatum TaxID=96803 RepID=A0A5N5TDH3_9CRUS|nr:Innexin inx2 [Armadillidium nasatum]